MNSIVTSQTEFRNVSSVKDMTLMFYSAAAFNSDISDWNVSGVTTMTHMFYSAAAFRAHDGGCRHYKVAMAFNRLTNGRFCEQNLDCVNSYFACDANCHETCSSASPSDTSLSPLVLGLVITSAVILSLIGGICLYKNFRPTGGSTTKSKTSSFNDSYRVENSLFAPFL